MKGADLIKFMTARLAAPVFLAALGMAFLTPGSGSAQTASPQALRLPGILSDNMVLQQEKPARIWGWAKPGAGVTVSIAGQKKSTTAGADGKSSDGNRRSQLARLHKGSASRPLQGRAVSVSPIRRVRNSRKMPSVRSA